MEKKTDIPIYLSIYIHTARQPETHKEIEIDRETKGAAIDRQNNR